MTGLPTPARCQYCATPLTGLKSVGRSRMYCDDGCRYAAHRRRAAEDPTRGTERFAQVLGTELTASEHSARWLVERVRADGQMLSSASLSEWRAGRSMPYLTEDTRESLLSLERYLPVPTGRLLAALEDTGRAKGKEGWQQPHRPAAPARSLAELKAKFEQDGVSNRGRLTLVEARESYVIGADRRPEESRNRCRVCALRPGVDRYIVMATVDDRCPAVLEARAGCRLGAQHRLTRRRYSVVATEVLLDRTLDAYEPYELEFGFVYPRSGGGRLPMPGWVRVVQDPGCRLLRMRLRFRGQRPKEVWRGTWKGVPGRTPKPEHEERVSATDGLFQLEMPNPRPDPYGFRWRWPGAMEVAR